MQVNDIDIEVPIEWKMVAIGVGEQSEQNETHDYFTS